MLIMNETVRVGTLDEANDEVIVRSYDVGEEKLVLLIAWAPILAAAAKALAVAIATRVGEAIGNELVNALSGKGGSAAFEKEVIARLKRIEEKLDGVIEFITKELPGLIATVTDNSINKSNFRLLNAKAGSIDGLINEFEKSQTKEDAIALRTKAIEILELARTILEQGKEWHMAGVNAWAAVLPAYSVLIRFDRKYAQTLVSHASKHVLIMEQWVDTQRADSFPNVISRLEAELADAQMNMAPPNEPTKDFLFAALGPGPEVDENNNIIQYRWDARRALLYNYDENGHWQGGIHRDWSSARNNDPTNPPWDKLLYRKLSWWTPILNAHENDEWPRLLSLVDLWQNRILKHPARIGEAKAVHLCVTKLIETCTTLADLKDA